MAHASDPWEGVVVAGKFCTGGEKFTRSKERSRVKCIDKYERDGQAVPVNRVHQIVDGKLKLYLCIDGVEDSCRPAP